MTETETMAMTTNPAVRIAGEIQAGYRVECKRSGLALFLTGAEVTDLHAITRDGESVAGYFVAPDADGEPTIWRGTTDGPAPQAVISRHDFQRAPELWDALVQAVAR